MSKIEKALERARATRGEAQPEIAPGRQAPEAESESAAEVRYTQTRIVDLDKGHLEKHRLMTLVDNPDAVDQYNLLRTQVLLRTREKGHNVLMVTSVLDGEGKTVTAINLAASIAREVKQTVLLVDTDLRHPRVHRYLGTPMEKGLSDCLQYGTPVSDLLVNPGLSGMVVLMAGKPLLGSTEVLGSPKMEKLVKEMKRRYPDRYVIFDCPPLLTVPDALIFSSYVDGVILVVEAGRTPKDQIRKAVELLEGRHIVGLVLNRAQGSHYGYYY